MKKTSLLIFFAAVVLLFLATGNNVFAFSVSLVSDIHADSVKERDNSKKRAKNIIYPKKYSKYLKKVFDNGSDLYIVLGDNTNTGSKKYAKRLAKLAENKNVLWVKGNHDGDSFKHLSSRTEYVYDRDNWRIIVIETKTNGMKSDSLNWLKEQLKTDKKVAICMHHPIWGDSWEDKEIRGFTDFRMAIAESGNVKYVFSGHIHVPRKKKIVNGIEYISVVALTLKNHKGFAKKLVLE